LKTFILLDKLKIKEGDNFPNQMGDVQTLIEKTLTQKFILEGTTVTLDDAIQLFNDFFSTKSNHKVWFSASDERDKKIISFTTNGFNPKDYNETIIFPFIKEIFKGQNIFGEISINDDLTKSVNNIYTHSIIYFASMIHSNKTLPYSLDQDFINQENINNNGKSIDATDIRNIFGMPGVGKYLLANMANRY
jgi:hypothetical protein